MANKRLKKIVCCGCGHHTFVSTDQADDPDWLTNFTCAKCDTMSYMHEGDPTLVEFGIVPTPGGGYTYDECRNVHA